MKSHRPERVANLIRQIVSDAIATKLSDPRIAPFASVTRVDMSPDLEYAHVYVSVMGELTVQRRTIAGLKSAAGTIQRMLAGELTMRHCPKLTFVLDDSIKKGAETIRLINEAMEEIHRDHPEETQEPEAAPEETNEAGQ